MSKRSDLVNLGRVVGVHGIQGHVKVKTYTECPENIVNYPLLIGVQELSTKYEKSDIKANLKFVKGEVAVIKLPDVNDRNAAELLVGRDIFTHAENLPEPEEGEYYHKDLIGLEARLANGQNFGKVEAIHNFGAGDIIEINLANTKKTEMFVFNNNAIPEINIEKGYIVINLPEGI